MQTNLIPTSIQVKGDNISLNETTGTPTLPREDLTQNDKSGVNLTLINHDTQNAIDSAGYSSLSKLNRDCSGEGKNNPLVA